MASRQEFVEYVADQLREAGGITYKKMFGEYGIYCDGKFFGVICNDQLFIKITKAGEAYGERLIQAPPYQGAKPYYLLEDVDDREFVTGLVAETCRELPPPRPARKKRI